MHVFSGVCLSVFFYDLQALFWAKTPVFLAYGGMLRVVASTRTITLCPRNRNLKTSKALLKCQAHQGTSLFTSAALLCLAVSCLCRLEVSRALSVLRSVVVYIRSPVSTGT